MGREGFMVSCKLKKIKIQTLSLHKKMEFRVKNLFSECGRFRGKLGFGHIYRRNP